MRLDDKAMALIAAYTATEHQHHPPGCAWCIVRGRISKGILMWAAEQANSDDALNAVQTIIAGPALKVVVLQ
jgi:hypothetical protein